MLDKCINKSHPEVKKMLQFIPGEGSVGSLIERLSAEKANLEQFRGDKPSFVTAIEVFDYFKKQLDSGKMTPVAFPIKGNEELYKDNNLLSEKGEIKTLTQLTAEGLKNWANKLNLKKKYKGTHYFKVSKTPLGEKIFIYPALNRPEPPNNSETQLPLFNQSGKEINRLSQYFTSDKSSSQDILKQIAKLDGGLGTIARKLLENKLDIPIELIDVPNFTNNNLPEGIPKFSDDNFSAAGFYYQGKIYIAKQTKFKDSTEGTLLHEILHAYTYNYIKNNPNTRSVQSLDDLVKYLNQSEISKLLRDKYPLTNVDELLVGIFTNPKLIEDLKLLEPKNKNFKSVWDQILQIFKVIFGVSDKTLFDEVFSASAQILDESMNQMKDIEEASEIDYVLANEAKDNTGKQKLISNKLDDLQRKVIRNPIDNSVKVEGFENIEWIRPSTEAKGDIQRRSFGITTEKQEEFSKLSQDVGTLVHAIQADIIKKNFPEFNKHIPSFTSDTDLSDFYSSLEEQMQPVIDSAKKRGSILKAEVFIGNTKSKRGGTVDLLEITTDGDFIVYDTKTRYSPDKSAKRRLNKIQEWSVQTGIYGDILKTGDTSMGVVSGKFLGAYILEFEFEKLGDYVNMKFNGAPRSTTVEKFLSRRRATMKIVAPTFLRTKNEKINKTIDILNRQIAELVKQKGGTAEQIMQRDRILSAKIELMQSLQLKMDTQRLIDQAYEDLGTIKTMLDKGDLSDSSFINEQLTFYSTLRSQIEDLDEAKSREIKAIMADANELIEQYKELTLQVAKAAVTKSGVSETLEKMGKSLDEPVQDSGKMFMLLMPTSQVDDPYIAAAVATTNVQLAKAREKTVELFKLMQEKADAYKKATGLNNYDSMIEDGKLVGEYSKEFWKEYNDAKSLKDFGWANKNLDFNKEEYQKARERQLNFYDAFRDTYKNQFKFKNPEATETEIDILVEKHIALEMKNWEDMNNNSFTYFKAKSKWANSKYTELMKGPKEAKELYEMFKSLIEYANEVMPDKVKRNFIPSFQKDYIERLSSLNLMNAIPEMMSGLLDNISMNYDDELYGKRNPVTGEKIGEMWIPGTSDVRDKSLDLPVVFFKFMEGVYRFQELSAVEETVLSIQRVVKDRNYVKVDRLGRIVPDQKAPAAPKTAANNASMLQSYIDSTFYGVKRKDDVGFEVEGNGFTELLGILKKGDKRKISVGKIVDKMISYTTIRNLGFNLYSPIVNIIGGSANYWITGANGVYYSNAEFNKAIAMVLSKGVTPEGEKLNLILDWLQADTGEFIKEKTNELTTRKGAYLIEQYGPLSLMRESENVMKNVGTLAMLLSGKHGYTLDDFTVVDGKLQVNTDILSKEKFRQKVIRVNMKNLGGINPDDMMMVKQYIVGRMLMQHRSWLPSLFFDRFGRKRTDYILEQDIEGRYLTAFRLFKYYFNRSKFQELNDFEKANMKSAAMEAALLMGTGLLLFLLKSGLDDDDKKETWAKITTKVSSRAFSELLFFVDPTFESQYAILLNPAPVFGTTSDYAKFLGSMFNTEEDKRKKGPVERGIKLIPGVNKTTTFLEDLGLVDFDEK